MAAHQNHANPIAVIALLTTATGLLFKIAAIPFHQWAPDAYEGAPTSMTGFMSVAVKAAAWAMLLRILVWGLSPLRPVYVPLLVFVSVATMTGANLAALTQTNLKRLLAYSSIAHVGYMLLGLVAGDAHSPTADGIKGILIYLLVYTFMNLGAFAVITSLRQRDVIGDELDDIAGLYYYMKIANAMFMREAVDKTRLPISLGMRTALGITAFATLVIGIYPEPFIRAVNWSLGIAQSSPVASLVR